MCLILIAWRTSERFPLVIAANRDEYYARPSESARWWPEYPEILAGRDLQGGGTWLGITRSGRVAALTNYRDPKSQRDDAPSRGHLVLDFLRGAQSPQDYVAALRATADTYNGFNLLLGDLKQLFVFSNVSTRLETVEPGVHGLSNHLLDTPWPKVERGKKAVQKTLSTLPDTSALFLALKDQQIAADEALPDTGIGIEMERCLSPPFIHFPNYGTRCSTVLLAGKSVLFEERSFGANGEERGRIAQSWAI
ncbi:MAG: NRDE family protein [Betaproteobacteria bacterium]|nr:NRDE family protein [Betaproteobacteria bacterium]